MSRPFYFPFILSAHLILCSSCWSIDDSLITPSQILAESRLKEGVQLANGPDIYVAVAELFDQRGAIDARQTDITSQDVNLAWRSNADADKLTFVLGLAKGTTVMDVLREVAKRRSERLTISENYVIITPDPKVPLQATYRQKHIGQSADLETMVRAVIPRPIVIREPGGDWLENFINAKFQDTWLLFHEGASPFRIKMSANAKQRVSTVNIIGNWSYQELFDSLGALSGLQWQIDGKTVNLEKTDPAKK